MAQENIAYDLSLFETKEQTARVERRRAESSAPQLREIQNPEAKRRVKPAKWIACGLLIFTMMAVHVGNNAMMTEARANVHAAEDELQEIQNKENLLDVELDKLLSIQNIDAYAKEKLGLCKPEQYQVEYLTGENGDKISVNHQEVDLWEKLRALFTGEKA